MSSGLIIMLPHASLHHGIKLLVHLGTGWALNCRHWFITILFSFVVNLHVTLKSSTDVIFGRPFSVSQMSKGRESLPYTRLS